MSKYVIGGGISGLIFSFYNPEYKIFSKQIGGQLDSKIPLGPRIIQKTEETKQLLEDLGIEAKVKTARIGYYYEGEIHEKCPEHLLVEYYKKSRCLSEVDLCEIPSSAMSGSKESLEYYDVSFEKIIKSLSSKVDILSSDVKMITDKALLTYDLVNGENSFKYENIISTIPAPSFCRIYHPRIKHKFKYLGKIFMSIPLDKKLIGDFDYVYFPTNEFLFHRATKAGKDKLVIEYTYNQNKKFDPPAWKNSSGTEYIEIGQIIPNTIDFFIENVYFLGRYAAWDHSIKIQDVIRQSVNMAKIRMLIERNFVYDPSKETWVNGNKVIENSLVFLSDLKYFKYVVTMVCGR